METSDTIKLFMFTPEESTFFTSFFGIGKELKVMCKRFGLALANKPENLAAGIKISPYFCLPFLSVSYSAPKSIFGLDKLFFRLFFRLFL